jgi:hypothetical protein
MRPVGTRDRKDLYLKIRKLLKKHPNGMISYQIAQELKETHCTIQRKYLPDLVKQGTVITEPVSKKRVLYKLSQTVTNQNTK